MTLIIFPSLVFAVRVFHRRVDKRIMQEALCCWSQIWMWRENCLIEKCVFPFCQASSKSPESALFQI